MEDSQIIELYWQRDTDAIAETDRKYGAYCFTIARNILHSREDSEECVNDTWLKAWNAIPPQKPAGNLQRKGGGAGIFLFPGRHGRPGTGRSGSRLLSAEGYPQREYTEILWEENRAVSCIGIIENGTPAGLQQKTRFLFTEFDGLDISFHENDLDAAYLNYRVGIGYGNPFGKFRTLIPLGNGLYARCAHPGKGPGGFDLFDFSDSSAPCASTVPRPPSAAMTPLTMPGMSMMNILSGL